MLRLMLIIFSLLLMNTALADSSYCQQAGSTITPIVLNKLTSNQLPIPAKSAEVVFYKLGQGACFYHYSHGGTGNTVLNQNLIFEMASITKIFTSLVLADQLVNLGPYHLTDINAPIQLPERFNFTGKISWQQLATFTAGFQSNDPPGWQYGDYSENDFINYIKGFVPQKPIPDVTQGLPCYQYYSNTSYALLGQALLYVDKYHYGEVGFSQWLHAFILNSLKMKHTRVWPKGQYAQGYRYQNGQYIPTVKFAWSYKGAAGALRSNATDMAKLLPVLICAYHQTDPDCAAYNVGSLKEIMNAIVYATTPQQYTPSGSLKNKTIYVISQQTGKPFTNNIQTALGWYVLPSPHVILKDGDHPGFSSWIGFNPEKSEAVFLVANTGGIKTIGQVGLGLLNQL